MILSCCSLNLSAVTPSFTIIRNIYFGVVLPDPGGCRMLAKTGDIVTNDGQRTCILPEDAQNGRYTIIANPNKTIRVSIQPNQDNSDGIIFNPYMQLESDGFTPKIIFNNTGDQTINSGPDGMVELYLGGDLTLTTTFPYNQTISFSFLDSIEWSEDP